MTFQTVKPSWQHRLPYIVFAQWTVSSSSLYHAILSTRGKKTGHSLKRPEDCGIDVRIVAIDHINALYIVNNSGRTD
jgi:hypothetical protein